jgi:hypothetical protein
VDAQNNVLPFEMHCVSHLPDYIGKETEAHRQIYRHIHSPQDSRVEL